AGYPCVNIPAVRVVPTLSADDLEDVVASDFDCAVFTSQVSVKVLEELLAREGLWERFTSKLRKAKVVAIGPKTGELLEEGGVSVDVVPKKYCSSELARVLASGDLSGARVVLFRSAEADESLEEELKKWEWCFREQRFPLI
ncbi:MAG TPA: hypothetical protein EYP32_03805, partial [Aquificaceae bacterium]|nr:hypothetical protein [Aquificaceae bacterium]